MLGGVGLLAVLLATTVLPARAPGFGVGVYALAAGAAALVFLLSLLGHEVAHALVARSSGIEVRRITLWLLGGVSELGGKPSGPGVEVRVALAGPLVSLGSAWCSRFSPSSERRVAGRVSSSSR